MLAADNAILVNRLVGGPFLLKGLLQQKHRFFQPKLLGPGLQGAVAGDLIVFDRLSRENKTGIESRAPFELLHVPEAIETNQKPGAHATLPGG